MVALLPTDVQTSLPTATVWYEAGVPATVWYDPDDFACDHSPTSPTEDTSSITSGDFYVD